jgi:hypothetical protein
MFMIAINGEVRAGKTWLARRLKDVFKPELTIIRSARDEIWTEVKREYGWVDDYESFREKRFLDGQTGRAKLIEWAEMRQRVDPGYWIKRMARTIPSNVQLVLNDSIADPIEQLYLYSAAPVFHQIITIVVAPDAIPLYGLYADNYRRRVFPMNGFSAPDSLTALAMCDERLNNPPEGSIWHQLRLAGLMAWQ